MGYPPLVKVGPREAGKVRGRADPKGLRMTPIVIDRIQRGVPMTPRFEKWLDPKAPVKRGAGYEVKVHSGRHEEVENAPATRTARTLLDIRVDGERRVELAVFPGHKAFLVVISGAGRIEGDDTAVKTDDIVWFKTVEGAEPEFLGLEADVELRALLYSDHSLE
jgi:redox-sensitive bicupin YhaK (pirin superfamily)